MTAMLAKPTIPDKIAAMSASMPRAVLPLWMRDFPASVPAPVMAMMESKREKRALAVRVRPRNRPALIVMPERLVPGMRARAWARPMNRAFFHVRVFSLCVSGNFLSAIPRSMPKRMDAHAIISTERRKAG